MPGLRVNLFLPSWPRLRREQVHDEIVNGLGVLQRLFVFGRLWLDGESGVRVNETVLAYGVSASAASVIHEFVEATVAPDPGEFVESVIERGL
jgi:hypothetical protein